MYVELATDAVDGGATLPAGDVPGDPPYEARETASTPEAAEQLLHAAMVFLDDVDHVHRVNRGVRDVDAVALRSGDRVSVIEALARPARQRDRARRPQTQAFVFVRQYAYSASRTGREASRCFWSFG